MNLLEGRRFRNAIDTEWGVCREKDDRRDYRRIEYNL